MKIKTTMSYKELEELGSVVDEFDISKSGNSKILSDNNSKEIIAKENQYQRKGIIIGLTGILVTALIFGLTFISPSCNYPSMEELRKKELAIKQAELERKCNYILPPEGKKITYMLRDGKKERIVTAEHYDTWRWGDACLKIEINNMVFESKGISLEEIGILENVRIRKGRNDWEVFENGKFQNYDSWQNEYASLVDRIAKTRGKFERNILEIAKY